jgi:glycine cleavage system H lipoate-binding protein
MPFSGKIEEVNWEYCKNSFELNSKFDEKHWIVKISIDKPINMSRLLTSEQYKSYKSQKALHLIKYLLSINGPDL